MVGEPVWLFICTRRIIDSLCAFKCLLHLVITYVCQNRTSSCTVGLFCMSMLCCHVLFKLNELCGGICLKLKDGGTDENNKVQ